MNQKYEVGDILQWKRYPTGSKYVFILLSKKIEKENTVWNVLFNDDGGWWAYSENFLMSSAVNFTSGLQ